MVEFDHQWKNIPSPLTEYNNDRIDEFRNFTKIDTDKWILGKECLDVGCGVRA